MTLVIAILVWTLAQVGVKDSAVPKSLFKVPEGLGGICALEVQPEAERQLRVVISKAVFRIKVGDPEGAEIVKLDPAPTYGVAGAFILPETSLHNVRYAFAEALGNGASMVTAYDGAGKLIRTTKVPYTGKRFDTVKRAWISDGEREPRMLVMAPREREWYLVGLISSEVSKVMVAKMLTENNVHTVGLPNGEHVIAMLHDDKVECRGLDGRLVGELPLGHVPKGIIGANMPRGSHSLRRLPRCDRVLCAEYWVEEGSPFNKSSFVRITDAGTPELFRGKANEAVNPGVKCVREGQPCVFMVTEFLNDPQNQHIGRRVRLLRDGVQAVSILDEFDAMDTQAGDLASRPTFFTDTGVYLAGYQEVFRISLPPARAGGADHP